MKIVRETTSQLSAIENHIFGLMAEIENIALVECKGEYPSTDFVHWLVSKRRMLETFERDLKRRTK